MVCPFVAIGVCNSDWSSLHLHRLPDLLLPQSQAEQRLWFGTLLVLFYDFPLAFAVEGNVPWTLTNGLVVEQQKVKILPQMPDQQEPVQQALADPAVQCWNSIPTT
jgi:hypothetical protein